MMKINPKGNTISIVLVLLCLLLLCACNSLSSKDKIAIDENTKLDEEQKAYIDTVTGKYKLFYIQSDFGVSKINKDFVIDCKDFQVRAILNNNIIDTFTINANFFSSKAVCGRFVKENASYGFRTVTDSGKFSVFPDSTFYIKDISCDKNEATQIIDKLYSDRGALYSFWSNFQSVLKTNDKEKVSAFFSFPFTDDRMEARTGQIKSLAAINSSTFADRVYDEIFTTENINLILDSKPLQETFDRYIFSSEFYFNIKIDGNINKLYIMKKGSEYKIQGLPYLGF